MCFQTLSLRPHPFHCILPTHVLKQIAAKAVDPKLRSFALDAMEVTETFRVSRAADIERHRISRRLRHERGKILRGVLSPFAASTCTKNRTIFDAQGKQKVPGVRVMKEGDAPSVDPVVQQAYQGLGDTFDFYADVFQRKSIDDACLAMDATVHFGQGYDNAFWDGHRMIFGDGDGQLFNAFTSSLDVIGHELTHGVTQYSSSLIYFGQSGALNEHISDVFGILIKQKKLGLTVAQSDWLIGFGLFTNNVQPVGKAALRSMKAPGTAYNDPVLGKDPQPADMDHYVHSLQDNGGVHTNSGIPNRAFYLFANNIGPDTFAWNTAGKVWYQATQSSRMGSIMSFKRFANLSRLIAATQFDSTVEKALVDAWAEVGIKTRTQSLLRAA